MTLSERLAEAAKAREAVAAGRPVPTRPADRRPARDPEVVHDEITIVLSPLTPVTAVDPDPDVPAAQVCPTCSRTGIVGLVDLARQTTDYTCSTCGTMWRHSRPRSDILLPPTR